MKGGPLSADGIYQMIVKRTTEKLGKCIYPHLFRDIAATAFAMHRREEVQLSRDLLGHVSLKTTEKHYLHAGSSRAGAHYGRLIASLRRRTGSS